MTAITAHNATLEEAEAPAKPKSLGARWVALDRLRALATLLMIQGHCFHALLDPAERVGTWHRFHKLFHGLTAPMFLMGAGLAFGITTYARWDAFSDGGEAHRSRLRRYAMIALLGYAIQLPGHSVALALHASPERWLRIVSVGPLQLIGGSLFFAQLAVPHVRSPRVHATVAGMIGLTAMIIAPFAWHLQLTDVNSPFLLAWLNGNEGSQFPALPWIAFLTLAMATSALCTEPTAARWLRSGVVWVVAGLSMSVGTYLLYKAGHRYYGEHDFWHSNPLFTIFRIGGVATCLGVLSIAASRVTRMDRSLAILARHSLLAYVGHLILLYGFYPIPGFVHALGRNELKLDVATLAAVALVTATVLVIIARRKISRTPRLRDAAPIILATGAALLFLR